MAEFQKVMEQYDRMCNSDMGCENCPISARNNGTGVICNLFVHQFPKDTERIILRWASEHPILTNRKKFEEVFGFNVATMFEINRGNAAWLDEEYQETK